MRFDSVKEDFDEKKICEEKKMCERTAVKQYFWELILVVKFVIDSVAIRFFFNCAQMTCKNQINKQYYHVW